MAYEDAYINGFCKAAAVACVDPVFLYKQAQRKARITSMLRKGVLSIRGRRGRDPATSVKKTLDSQTGSCTQQKPCQVTG